MLHNGLAVCHMKMGEWEDAERDLQEALGKDAKDADTLANLITVCVCVGGGDTVGWRGGEEAHHSEDLQEEGHAGAIV